MVGVERLILDAGDNYYPHDAIIAPHEPNISMLRFRKLTVDLIDRIKKVGHETGFKEYQPLPFDQQPFACSVVTFCHGFSTGILADYIFQFTPPEVQEKCGKENFTMADFLNFRRLKRSNTYFGSYVNLPLSRDTGERRAYIGSTYAKKGGFQLRTSQHRVDTSIPRSRAEKRGVWKTLHYQWIRENNADLDFALIAQFPRDQRWKPLIRFSEGFFMLFFGLISTKVSTWNPQSTIDTLRSIRAAVPGLPDLGHHGLNNASPFKQGFDLDIVGILKKEGVCFFDGCKRPTIGPKRMGDWLGERVCSKHKILAQLEDPVFLSMGPCVNCGAERGSLTDISRRQNTGKMRQFNGSGKTSICNLCYQYRRKTNKNRSVIPVHDHTKCANCSLPLGLEKTMPWYKVRYKKTRHEGELIFTLILSTDGKHRCLTCSQHLSIHKVDSSHMWTVGCDMCGIAESPETGKFVEGKPKTYRRCSVCYKEDIRMMKNEKARKRWSERKRVEGEK